MKARTKTAPRTKTGTCRWCGGPVKPPRRTWCSDKCVHEARIRSDQGYARHCVLERDHGVCEICGLSMVAVAKSISRHIRKRFRRRPDEYDRRWGHRKIIVNKVAAFRWVCSIHGIHRHRVITVRYGDLDPKALWDMDHRVPVVEGGGACGLDNLRTLCVWCHAKETAKLAGRRAQKRTGQMALGGGW